MFGKNRPFVVFVKKSAWQGRGFAVVLKGAGHKHVKREPTGKPPPAKRWRYWYRTPQGGLVSSDGLKEGQKFQHGEGDQSGHYHVDAVDHAGDRVSVTHDETGDSRSMSRQEFADMVNAHHEDRRRRKVGEARGKIAAFAREALAEKDGDRAKELAGALDDLAGGKDPDKAVELTKKPEPKEEPQPEPQPEPKETSKEESEPKGKTSEITFSELEDDKAAMQMVFDQVFNHPSGSHNIDEVLALNAEINEARQQGKHFDSLGRAKEMIAKLQEKYNEKEAKKREAEEKARLSTERFLKEKAARVQEIFDRPRTVDNLKKMLRNSDDRYALGNIKYAISLYKKGDKDSLREGSALAWAKFVDDDSVEAFEKDPASFEGVVNELKSELDNEFKKLVEKEIKKRGDAKVQENAKAQASRRDAMLRGINKNDGWREFLPSSMTEAQEQYINGNKEAIQTLWDRYRLPVLPPENIKDGNMRIDAIAFASLGSALDGLSQAFDIKATLSLACVPVTFDPTLQEGQEEGFVLGGDYRPDVHKMNIVNVFRGGNTFVHELFHALDFIAGNGNLPSNKDYYYPTVSELKPSPLQGFLETKMSGHAVSMSQNKDFDDYLNRPHERLARTFEQFFSPAAGTDMNVPKGDQIAGYWGSDHMADNADSIADYAKTLGVKVKPEYVQRIKDMHPNVIKEKEIAAEKEKKKSNKAEIDRLHKLAIGQSWEGLPEHLREKFTHHYHDALDQVIGKIRNGELGAEHKPELQAISRKMNKMDAIDGTIDPRPAYTELLEKYGHLIA